jgi:hypothetical protein
MAPQSRTEVQEYLDNAWLRLGDVRKIKRKNPLKKCLKDRDFPGYTELKVMRDAEYLAFAAKTLLGIKILPEQAAILEELWKRPFPMYIASRGFGKSFLIALYSVLKMVLTPHNNGGGASVKIVIVGAAFRQSKVIFEYMESIWRNAPILRSVCDSQSGPKKDVDRCTMHINENWAVAIPLGDGSKIRGLRATIIIADEFASIPPDIYETVVQGFASVSADPIENVDEFYRREAKKEMGIWTENEEKNYKEKTGNQIIISGTADYEFKPFATYWKRYKDFIMSGGKYENLRQWFPDGVPESFNHKDFSIIRIPYELIPKGFMDDKVVMRAKATVHSGIYQMEYGACFTSDSNGFFRRSLIESCVTSDKNPIVLPSGQIWFDALTRGNSTKRYVYGVDPASEADNFSIVVIELDIDHSRVVYCWTTNRADFKKRHAAKVTNEDDFYGFCARKIRDLMRTFPCERIGMDAQGGGIAVMEALHDRDKLMPGEVQIWPVIDPDKEKDTDGFPGLHILEMVQFANYEWTSTANHGLRKDLEGKAILFPRFDPLTLELAAHEDKARSDAYKVKYPGRELTIYDSLEDCVMEIEELKNELTTIVITRTGTGVNSRDRWDTPEVKLDNGRKGRLRKDRYSSFLIANMMARQYHRTPDAVEYDAIGGFASDLNTPHNGEQLYSGPVWFTEVANDTYRGVKRIRR